MGEMLKHSKAPIQPIYSQTEPNQSIELGCVPVQFVYKGETYADSANVTMRFTPSPRLEFVIPDTGSGATISPLLAFDLNEGDNWDKNLALREGAASLPVHCLGAGGDHGVLAFTPCASAVTVTAPSMDIVFATFHLFNFPDFCGPEDYIFTGLSNGPTLFQMKRCGLTTLRSDDWVITIAETEKTDDLVGLLNRQGGFLVTHMGSIRREDGSAFSTEELDTLLHGLHYFLSFALGRWAGVALPCGFDANGNRVFEQRTGRRSIRERILATSPKVP